MKNILIKYLSLEAIENTVTCIKYKLDEVIFFAEKNVYEEENNNIYSFLENECKTKVTNTLLIDNNDVNSIYKRLEKIITNKNNNYFLDLTGANALFLSAATLINKNHKIPTYVVDIKNDEIINLDFDDKQNNITNLNKNKVNLTINKMIKMIGGCVVSNNIQSRKKKIKNSLLVLRKEYKTVWNDFSNVIKDLHRNSNYFRVYKSYFKKLKSFKYSDFINIIYTAEELGICKILSFNDSNNPYIECVFHENKDIEVIKDAGSILENNEYIKYKEISDDCLVSVKLDWDGVITPDEIDLTNEIDVITLDKYILTFISCKNRIIKKEDIYEIASVARNFAGNYAKMKLVSPYGATREIQQRAKEFGVIIEKE